MRISVGEKRSVGRGQERYVQDIDCLLYTSGATTVLVAPLTGSVEKDFDTHIRLSAGETGLHPSSIRCEDITVVNKELLVEPKSPLRTLSNTRVCQIADAVRMAMGCPAK